LHAPNNRYVNDEQVAQAVAQMFSRIGVTTRVQTQPINVYLPKARGAEFSFAMLGWGSFSADLAMRALVATPDAGKGFGTWNWSHYSNPALDRLLEQGFASVEPHKRESLAREAVRLAHKDIAMITLHQQMATWALKRPLGYAARTDEYTFAHHIRATR
jgi:peptide/nickel transport system substrate-binding protein